VVVLDPHSREVLAMAGGYRTRVADFNRATMARRQPGSAFKPFVYAAAIETGEMTAASIINDAPEVYNLWKPENYERGAFAGPVRLRVALARSINTVAIRVLHDVGPERAAELARRMGIESQLPTTLSLALGSGEVTPLELTNAYATFAAGGKVPPPRFIAAIDGERIEPEPEQEALGPEAAFVLVDMMRSVVEEGTAGRARALRLPVSGKTGTSNDARDGWFIGMTPNLVVGVWVGFDDNRPLGRGEGGSRSALPIYVKVMEALGARERARSYTRPPGVVEARIDKATGLLAPVGAQADDVYTEVFLEGTVPVETAPAPGQVDGADFVLDSYDDLFYAYEETPADPAARAADEDAQ
jgi:penicillin-binding protein 1A